MISCGQTGSAPGACSLSPDQEQGPREWRMPEKLGERLQRRRPPRKLHPLGCQRPRVDDRQAREARFFGRRTGCQGNALNAPGLCSRRSAHRRVPAWTAAGVGLAMWTNGLVEYAAWTGIDGEWLAMDGAMTQAPLGGETGGHEADRPRDAGPQTARPPRRRRRPPGPRRRGGQADRRQEGRGDAHAPPDRAPAAPPSAAAGDGLGPRR